MVQDGNLLNVLHECCMADSIRSGPFGRDIDQVKRLLHLVEISNESPLLIFNYMLYFWNYVLFHRGYFFTRQRILY